MSHYPQPPDYGQGYGSQEQTQQPPYVPPFPNPYLQPGTGHQQSYAYPMASHMGSNEGAYGYNQNIPSAALAPSVPPLPLFQGWNQDTIPLPPYTAPQAPSYNAGYYNNQAYTPAPQQNQQNPVHQPYAPYVKPAEEGELSEGEFEYGNPASSTQPNTYESAQHWNNDSNGYVDTAHRAVYARNQDGPSRGASDYNYGRASPQTRRRESDSYSPYTSPRETDYSPANRDQQYNSNGQGYRPSPPASKRGNQRSFSSGGNQKHPRVKGTPDPYKSDSHANDFHNRQVQTSAKSERPQAQTSPSEVAAPGITSNGERTKAEAELQRYRKEAQAALVQLSEENVHYLTYIAEGFDQGLVGRYFDDLKLPKTAAKEVIQTTTILHTTNGANGTAVTHKISDTLSQNSKPDAPQVAQTPAKPTAPIKPTAPTEKEIQLKQKMEALRKSREERAQKAAAKNNPVSPVATVEKPEQSKDLVKDKSSTSPVVTEPPTAMEPPNLQETPTFSTAISVQPTREISLPKRPSSPKETRPQQPIVPIPAPQAGPVIPGLFLASTATSASAAPNSPYSSLQSNARKRPVAADFDVPTSFTPKRPFGQSRDDRPLVIDVSEDEDEDVAMDLDSQYDQNSPVQPGRKLSETRSTTINNLAPLSDVPSRKLFSTPPVLDTTPPAVQTITKSTLGKPEDLERKMKEIEEMKKRIADAERRKKAKQSSSGSNTPRRIENGSNDGNLANKVAASIQIDRLVTMAENKATADQQKLAEAQADEVQKAAELKRHEAEQKRLRRERLSQELPRVDAGVQEKQAQMEELQAKMAQIQAEIQKDLEEKQRMIEEREKLGQEAEDQLQAQKDKLQDLNSQESGSSTAPSRPASVHIPETEDASKSSSSVTQDQTTQPEFLEPEIPVVESAPIISEQEPTKSPPVVATPSLPHNEIEVSQPVAQTMEVEQGATPDQMDAALQEAMRAEVDSLEIAGTGVPDVEMDDSYAPDPNQLAPASVSSSVDKNAQSPVASPVLQRNAMQIPDGESDDYEPPEATPSLVAGDDQEDHNEPDEHDAYEPPEALPMDVDLLPKVDPNSPAHESSHVECPPFSPVPPEHALDVAAQSPNVGLLSTGVNEQDDIESTVPSQSSALQQPVVENDTEETSNKAIQSFTPYESPLKLFRAYRFHPAFKDEIPGGYRSLTYNHKFDPLKELCRYELAGGICNDVDCDLQHFKNVGLSDNDVLTSLTSHNTFTGEQRTRFVTGLKEVFTGLREKNLDKDFDSIASALVAHRAKFLGDNSKVLPLEGTTI